MLTKDCVLSRVRALIQMHQSKRAGSVVVAGPTQEWGHPVVYYAHCCTQCGPWQLQPKVAQIRVHNNLPTKN